MSGKKPLQPRQSIEKVRGINPLEAAFPPGNQYRTHILNEPEKAYPWLEKLQEHESYLVKQISKVYLPLDSLIKDISHLYESIPSPLVVRSIKEYQNNLKLHKTSLIDHYTNRLEEIRFLIQCFYSPTNGISYEFLIKNLNLYYNQFISFHEQVKQWIEHQKKQFNNIYQAIIELENLSLVSSLQKLESQLSDFHSQIIDSHEKENEFLNYIKNFLGTNPDSDETMPLHQQMQDYDENQEVGFEIPVGLGGGPSLRFQPKPLYSEVQAGIAIDVGNQEEVDQTPDMSGKLSKEPSDATSKQNDPFITPYLQRKKQQNNQSSPSSKVVNIDKELIELLRNKTNKKLQGKKNPLGQKHNRKYGFDQLTNFNQSKQEIYKENYCVENAADGGFSITSGGVNKQEKVAVTLRQQIAQQPPRLFIQKKDNENDSIDLMLSLAMEAKKSLGSSARITINIPRLPIDNQENYIRDAAEILAKAKPLELNIQIKIPEREINPNDRTMYENFQKNIEKLASDKNYVIDERLKPQRDFGTI